MGWDGIFIHTPHKTNSEKIACFNSYYKFDFAKAVIKNGVLYGAVKDINRETNEPIVWGLVAIINFYTNKFETEMRCKLMDETMHPYYYNCPKSILDLLTKTDNEYSNEWRKRCYEQLAKAKEKAKVKTPYIFVKSGIKFSIGCTYHVFKKDPTMRTKYHTFETGYGLRISHINDFDVQYISEEQYLRCKDAYYKIRDAKILVEYEKTNDPELIKLSQLELCDVYQKAINQTE